MNGIKLTLVNLLVCDWPGSGEDPCHNGDSELTSWPQTFHVSIGYSMLLMLHHPTFELRRPSTWAKVEHKESIRYSPYPASFNMQRVYRFVIHHIAAWTVHSKTATTPPSVVDL